MDSPVFEKSSRKFIKRSCSTNSRLPSFIKQPCLSISVLRCRTSQRMSQMGLWSLIYCGSGFHLDWYITTPFQELRCDIAPLCSLRSYEVGVVCDLCVFVCSTHRINQIRGDSVVVFLHCFIFGDSQTLLEGCLPAA